MKIESPEFAVEDLDRFMDEFADHERVQLADRLARASARLQALAPRIPAAGGAGEGWTAHEVLAHVAVLSKFYGMLAYKIGRGDLTELDLLSNVGARDLAGEQMAQLPVETLAENAAADHKRTEAYLRSATASDLRRRCDMGHGRSLSAEEIARGPLVAHLELHLDQLESRLGRGSSAIS